MRLGKLVGAMMFIAATAAIWFWPAAKPELPPPEPVRPVRAAVVGVARRMPDLRFSGIAKPKENRVLSFKQSGRIERIPVSKSQRVKRGEPLAWLFREDFSNDLSRAEAVAERDRLTFRRVSEAGARNAVSREEISRSESSLKQSEAALQLARRAFAETTLVAPFDAVVADVIATELDMVGPGAPVLVLQDLSAIKIDVAMPETYVIAARRLKCDCQKAISVTFDSMSERSYPARFVEYATKADEKTQTYMATYTIDPPDELYVLPGMSATLTVDGSAYRYETGDDRALIAVSESALGVDAAGGFYVWRLEKCETDGVYIARRTAVVPGARAAGEVEIRSGLQGGELVATAGVAVITDGRRVSLLKD